MATSGVMATLPRGRARRFDVRIPLAFAAIYFLWGTTFLAIRIAVLEMPPFFTAGLRFFIAGTLLDGFMRLRGQPGPSPGEWRSIAVTALCMFVATYAALFWAQQYVPSGIAAVIEATLPITTIALEVFVFRQQAFRLSLLGAVLTRSMRRPRSVVLAGGAQMMLGGAALLALSQLTGELDPIPHVTLRAALALSYLIVAGSLVAFTAYVWLLARMPATRVASHAYVNPVVAVGVGYFVAGEALTTRMIAASVLVVASVFLILKTPTDPDSRAR